MPEPDVCQLGLLHAAHLCCCARRQVEERIRSSHLWFKIAALAFLTIPLVFMLVDVNWLIPVATMPIQLVVGLFAVCFAIAQRLQAWWELARIEAARALPVVRVVR